jgi:type II secretory pathway component PulF
MAETKAKQKEQAQAFETPDDKSDRDELLEASQQFFRSLLRAGVHLAMAPMSIFPEEPREHFRTAGLEITRGLAALAHELANDFEKLMNEVREDVEKD